MSFKDIVNKDQRQVILNALEQDPDYSHNAHVIKQVLQSVGHSISSDQVDTHLHWLAEQGLVTLGDVAGVTVARLTDRGQDVAIGAIQVPGVARPRPGA